MSDMSTPPTRPKNPVTSAISYATMAILAGVFILGIGVGIAFTSVANTSEGNVATREAIDLAAPNPELCVQYGASAIVTDIRVYQTLSPFTVLVSQPKSQPGCVLRSSNWSILEQKQLVNSEQVRNCRNRMNTFGFIGNLNESPQVTCLYQTDNISTFFRNSNPAGGSAPRETEQF
jgi:hypothetical protein